MCVVLTTRDTKMRARPHGERGDQLLHLVVLGEDLATGRPRITEGVADEGEVFRFLIAQGADQARRKTVRDPETGDGDRRSVGDVRDGLRGRCQDLVHRAGHTGSL